MYKQRCTIVFLYTLPAINILFHKRAAEERREKLRLCSVSAKNPHFMHDHFICLFLVKTQVMGEIKIALKREMRTEGEHLVLEILQCRNITYKFKTPDHLPGNENSLSSVTWSCRFSNIHESQKNPRKHLLGLLNPFLFYWGTAAVVTIFLLAYPHV